MAHVEALIKLDLLTIEFTNDAVDLLRVPSHKSTIVLNITEINCSRASRRPAHAAELN